MEWESNKVIKGIQFSQFNQPCVAKNSVNNSFQAKSSELKADSVSFGHNNDDKLAENIADRVAVKLTNNESFISKLAKAINSYEKDSSKQNIEDIDDFIESMDVVVKFDGEDDIKVKAGVLHNFTFSVGATVLELHSNGTDTEIIDPFKRTLKDLRGILEGKTVDDKNIKDFANYLIEKSHTERNYLGLMKGLHETVSTLLSKENELSKYIGFKYITAINTLPMETEEIPAPEQQPTLEQEQVFGYQQLDFIPRKPVKSTRNSPACLPAE